MQNFMIADENGDRVIDAKDLKLRDANNLKNSSTGKLEGDLDGDGIIDDHEAEELFVQSILENQERRSKTERDAAKW